MAIAESRDRPGRKRSDPGRLDGQNNAQQVPAVLVMVWGGPAGEIMGKITGKIMGKTMGGAAASLNGGVDGL